MIFKKIIFIKIKLHKHNDKKGASHISHHFTGQHSLLTPYNSTCRIPSDGSRSARTERAASSYLPLSVSQFRIMPRCTLPKDLSTSQRTASRFCCSSGESHSVLFRTHNYKQNLLLAVKTTVPLSSLREHVVGEKCRYGTGFLETSETEWLR